MYILGVSAFYHDSAAVLLKDGKIIAAAQEERFTRKKHDARFPESAIKYCLDEAGILLGDITVLAFYDKPLLKFERLIETYYAYAPRGILSFITSVPVWLKEKMFLKREIKRGLANIGSVNKQIKLLFPEHHLSHAASTFYVSPFKEAAILTIDGVGEWATASIGYGKENTISIFKELRFPHSLGLLYSAFTYYLGFKVNSGEYKLMGLAPYGNYYSEEVKNYITKIKNEIVKIYPDGSIWLNQKYFQYATGLTMTKDSPWEKLFGFKRRNPNEELLEVHCNLGLAIQIITEEIVLQMAKEAKRLTGSENICLAGGVALNCVANGKLQESNLFKNLFITPPSGDAGGALGAALAAWHIFLSKARVVRENELDALHGSYLGPGVEEKDIRSVINKFNASATKYDDFEALANDVADFLKDGKIVAWMQGRMEFGPRALGSRSILADPRNAEMQQKLNLKIKYRESFRPFAPSVLIEDAASYFELDGASPYMLLVKPIKKNLRKQVPLAYKQLDVRQKLYYSRSYLPSVTHVDFSARVQTVHLETNPRYHKLIQAFKKKTGCSVLVNTSFNVRGEPIVCTPEDAYRCFMRTGIDYLIIGDFFFSKKDQPNWKKTDQWKEEFILD
nr:carbamoyltransferase [Chryseolinea sp. H1M3-3]